MSAQHNTFSISVTFIFVFLLVGCGGGAKYDGENDITLSISLGPSSGFPDGPDNQDDIFFYWGRSVIFTAKGIDDENSMVDLKGSVFLDWTGESHNDGTLYASHTFRLENEDGDYPGGQYIFKMFIDWNDNNVPDEGDVYLKSYTVYADQDEDAETEDTKVETDDWGQFIEYVENDNALRIVNPLDKSSGTPWIIRKVGEGELAIF